MDVTTEQKDSKVTKTKLLTPQEIREVVHEIELDSCDPEAAHGREDTLYHRFIQELAHGQHTNLDQIVEMSKELVKTKSLSFARWCA